MTLLNPVVTVREAAAQLGLSTQRVHQLIADRKLSARSNVLGHALVTQASITRRLKRYPKGAAK